MCADNHKSFGEWMDGVRGPMLISKPGFFPQKLSFIVRNLSNGDESREKSDEYRVNQFEKLENSYRRIFEVSVVQRTAGDLSVRSSRWRGGYTNKLRATHKAVCNPKVWLFNAAVNPSRFELSLDRLRVAEIQLDAPYKSEPGGESSFIIGSIGCLLEDVGIIAKNFSNLILLGKKTRIVRSSKTFNHSIISHNTFPRLQSNIEWIRGLNTRGESV
ncbi:uncharacterized protein LOC102673596 isoform X2 [Apis dorsata]|uniref:uncharacterized protein LOC102673596 isoform X2 n=1 Tax=Apis dorsata TaxID=7462 RepID=UPI001293D1B3|nr:uncharacterized protein LOC102673596 isoform X2 [Apis dorsata]XP_031365147.1 uncharacterized protein LOC102673596 isoform X2 [Apis dorsata]XP_031365148.1 uncharacterized protein LOC102673596 isoform X2 [Apis dorsata]